MHSVLYTYAAEFSNAYEKGYINRAEYEDVHRKIESVQGRMTYKTQCFLGNYSNGYVKNSDVDTLTVDSAIKLFIDQTGWGEIINAYELTVMNCRNRLGELTGTKGYEWTEREDIYRYTPLGAAMCPDGMEARHYPEMLRSQGVSPEVAKELLAGYGVEETDY